MMHVTMLCMFCCCYMMTVIHCDIAVKTCVAHRANADEDFEQFLESVRERSLTTRTKIAASQGMYLICYLNLC